MKNIIIGSIVIVTGCYIVVYRSRWARKAIEGQNKIFGFHFGKKDMQATSYVGLIVGSGFIILGILALLGIIESKW